MSKMVKKLICMAYDNNYVFYYISVLSLVFAKSLGLYSGDVEYKIIMAFSMLFLGLKLVFTKYNIKEFVIIALIIVYSAFIYMKTGYMTFTITAVMLCGVKDIDGILLLKQILFVKIICFAVLVSASVAGIVENTVKDQYAEGLTYSFGHNNPNEFMINLFMITLLIFYFRFEKLNILYYLLAGYAFFAVYMVSKSATGIMLGGLLLAAVIFMKLMERVGKIGEKIMQIISAIIIPTSLWCFIGTLVFSIKFDVNRSLDFKIDQLVSGRLKIQHQYWLNYGFSVLGKDLSRGAARFDGVQINNGILDSNYLCSFYKYGFVSEILFIAVLIIASYYYYKKNEYKMVVFINIICLYGLMEDFLISSVVNPILIPVGAAVYSLFQEKSRNEKIKKEQKTS